MAKINPQDLKDRLLAPGFTAPPVLEQLSDPISDTPMVLTLDQVLPWHDNPRTTRNPKYDELKESIRHRGLDTPPPVTRRPGEDKYRIRNGGNTRLEILNELYKETGDERYFRFNCLFRPWDKQRGEIIALTGHLAENDLKGDLKFIERASAFRKRKPGMRRRKENRSASASYLGSSPMTAIRSRTLTSAGCWMPLRYCFQPFQACCTRAWELIVSLAFSHCARLPWAAGNASTPVRVSTSRCCSRTHWQSSTVALTNSFSSVSRTNSSAR